MKTQTCENVSRDAIVKKPRNHYDKHPQHSFTPSISKPIPRIQPERTSLDGSIEMQRTHPRWPATTLEIFHGACHSGSTGANGLLRSASADEPAVAPAAAPPAPAPECRTMVPAAEDEEDEDEACFDAELWMEWAAVRKNKVDEMV
jgi:hypothetical protein